MGQKREVQPSVGSIPSTIEEAVDIGVDGAVELLDGELDVEVVVEVVAMISASCAKLLFSLNFVKGEGKYCEKCLKRRHTSKESGLLKLDHFS